MQTLIKNMFPLPALIAVLGLIHAGCVTAQTFRTVYSFRGAPPPPAYINDDGAWPSGGVILSGNTLYGTTDNGGSGGNGTLFAVSTDGSEFWTLHDFTAFPVPYVGNGPNNDGAGPGSL